MARIVYVNGRYLPYAQAFVHVEDRGFQFADGVYEVCEIFAGRLVDLSPHLARLARSLREIGMDMPMSERALRGVIRETVRRNRVRDGLLYMQVTRGQAPRDFLFPEPDVPPTMVLLARHSSPATGRRRAESGIAVITTRDIRWQRPDIKTLLLLPQVLARQAAREQGAGEAWLVDEEGYVTEGAASNAWIVTKDGVLVTRPSAARILKGVTRQTVLSLAASLGLSVEKRKFSVAEAKAAREAFVTAATALVMPVVAIDGVPVGDGTPGPITRRLREGLHEAAELWS